MRLRELRKEKNLSLRELSKIVNLSVPYLSQLETKSKNPSIETVRKLSLAFDISIEEFMEFPEPIRNQKNPDVCTEDKCDTICNRRHFCIGKTSKDIIVKVNNKTHRNNYFFCIISDLRGWSKFHVNLNDLRIIKDMILQVESGP